MNSAATDAEAIRQPDAPDGICAPQALAISETRALLAEAQAAATSVQEEFLRAKAETENVRRRAREDVQKAHKFAIENFAENLLPVVDSFEKVREGIEITLRQLSGAFEKGRIVEVNPVGEKFDPHVHQAISIVQADQEPNTVVKVLQKGYVIAGRMLRPALVTVATPK
jgi:molecular chaperone GrpE